MGGLLHLPDVHRELKEMYTWFQNAHTAWVSGPGAVSGPC